MTLEDILNAKGSHVFTTRPEATLEEVVHELTARNVGGLIVCTRDCPGGERPVGIITERDLLHVVASGRRELAAVKVSEVMTTKLITGSPTDAVEAVMGWMTNHRIRHLPVVVEGRLVGIVSIGDVVKAQLGHLAMENEFMRNYIAS